MLRSPRLHSTVGYHQTLRHEYSLPSGSGPYFQNKVLNGLIYVRQVFERLRAKNAAVNPKKTKLGLPEVEYVGHLVSATGTSFTPEKRLKVLDFPQPTTQKEMLQFIGLVNYFRDHVSNMTEMVKPSQQIPEDWQAHLEDRELCSIQALPTSYLKLSGTLLPREHCHIYPPN